MTTRDIFIRERTGASLRYNTFNYFKRIQSFDIVTSIARTGQPSPPFVTKFNHQSDKIITCNEDGLLSISSIPDTISDVRSDTLTTLQSDRIKTHDNAIFDFCWSADDRLVCTASADCSLNLWDIERSLWLRHLRGHTASVKSVQYHPTNPSLND